MIGAARTALTLAALGLLLAVAALWGWSAAMSPLPGKVDTPLCVPRAVDAGTKVYPQDVTVSVYNAGTREGLAGETMQALKDQGFAQGQSGNLRTKRPVGAAEIWTSEPDSPAVRLVASRLGRQVRIERRDPPGVGVSVLVGDDFGRVTKGKASVTAKSSTEICSPPVS